jgi:hypothetical protein
MKKDNSNLIKFFQENTYLSYKMRSFAGSKKDSILMFKMKTLRIFLLFKQVTQCHMNLLIHLMYSLRKVRMDRLKRKEYKKAKIKSYASNKEEVTI